MLWRSRCQFMNQRSGLIGSASVRKQPIIALYTEFETVLKFYNLKASFLEGGPLMWMMPMHLHINQKSDYDDDNDKRSENQHFRLI